MQNAIKQIVINCKIMNTWEITFIDGELTRKFISEALDPLAALSDFYFRQGYYEITLIQNLTV